MRKGFQILIPVLILIIVGIGLAVAAFKERQPTYQGKPLDYWLTGYYAPGNYKATHPNGPPPPSQVETVIAIRNMGTNAIPLLFRMLQARDSKFRSSISWLFDKQHIFKAPEPAGNQNSKALMGFGDLGPQAVPAIPRLIKMFNDDSSDFSQLAVPAILGHMGPDAEPAIPMLLQAATHTNEMVRNNAVYALGQIKAQPTLVVPALMNCLKDPSPYVQAGAACALGKFGKEARPALGALKELSQKTPYGTSLPQFTYGTPIFSTSWKPPLRGISPPDVAKAAKEASRAIERALARAEAYEHRDE